MDSTNTTDTIAENPPAEKTAMGVLLALSLSHMINDTLQVVLPASFPILKATFNLNFTQVGLIMFVYQLTASLFQPIIGFMADRRPQPRSLAIGMGFTLAGLLLLSLALNFSTLLVAAAVTGLGSSIFHPEGSRLTRLASGGRHGFAQSLFQVGGNLGTSFGPLLVAAVVSSRGQTGILWFTIGGIVGIGLLVQLGNWYRQTLARHRTHPRPVTAPPVALLPKRAVVRTLAVLMVLIFSKFIYLSSFTSYYTFYLIERFGVSVQQAQVYLFVFLFSAAAGTMLGGPVGDRFGRKWVIWFSILGAAPFTLLLPFADLAWTVVLSVFIGTILASAFSTILVYGQELLPGRVGLVAGLFFGFAFGMAGLGSALFGRLADHTSMSFVYRVCSFLPLLGLFTVFLPDLKRHTARP